MKWQGKVTGRPELHFAPNGSAVCTLQLLTKEGRVPVTTWAELAEKVNAGVKQDDEVEVYGYIKERWWTAKGGEKHNITSVNAHRIKVIARPIRPKYCCLSCKHWEADCLAGCYSAMGSSEDREVCRVEGNECMMLNTETGSLMNRDCWEG